MATSGGVKEVGIRLKVGAAGLENATALGKSLRDLGVDTTALDSKAQALDAELKALADQQRVIDAFVRTKAATVGAASGLETAQAAAQALGREMAQAEAPTKAQTAALDRARTAVTAAKDAYTAQRLELQQQRTALSAAGIGSDGLAAAQIRVRQQTEAAKQAAVTLTAQYKATADAAQASGAKQQVAAQGVGDSLKGLGTQLRTLQTLAGAAIGGQLLGGLAGDITKTADAYQNLQARIRLVTGEGAAFDTAFQGVFDIATRTNSSLETTGNLFTRIAQAGATIGRTQQESLALTETINQAIQLSGATAGASDAAIVQLVQGLQSGVLRGEEFNSVMEQAPRLAKALSDGLGVSTGELRKMAEQGQLTSATVIQALAGQSAAVQREFEKLPPTVGRALQNLSSHWTVYVGEVDQANGVSSTAAKAINLLAQNLDTLAGFLFSAGKAALAYKAINLAALFLEKAAAARVAATAVAAETAATAAHAAATTADTAATVANTAARTGNAAATVAIGKGLTGAGAAAAESAKGMGVAHAAAGLLGNALGAIKLFSLVGVLTNIREIGTTLGEGVAKWAGYGDAVADAELKLRADEAASKANMQAKQELAAQLQATAEAAQGLNKESRAIVATFDDVVTKGGSVADALEKVTKELQLGEPTGITNAVTALDALERKGKITADQVRAALAGALDGKDLAIFATNAKTAFDKSEQGARRLKAALDAVADEALKRAGTSVQELQGGFSKAMNSAINDTDALIQTLGDMGIKGEQAAQLVGKSLDKEIAAANTERAIKAVTDRVTELGRQGILSGEQVTEALTKIETKAGQLKKGVNTLAEALAILGIKSKEKLDQVAADSRAAFEFAEQSGKVSIGELIKAFNKMRDDAIAANNGIEPSWIRQKQLMLESKASAAGLGSSIVQAMGDAAKATDKASTAQERYNQLLRDDPSRLVGGNGLAGIGPSQDGTDFGVRSAGGEANKVNGLPPIDSYGALIRNTASGDVTRTVDGPQAVSPGEGWTYTLDPAQIVTKGIDERGNPVPGGWMRTPQPNRSLIGGNGFGGVPTMGVADSAFDISDPFGNAARTNAAPAADSGASYTVNVTIGGTRYGIAAASKKAADDMVRALEEAYRAGGGSGG